MVKKKHLQEELLIRAQSELLSNGWGFQLLRDIPKQDWVDMGIPRGAVFQIRRKQKDWIIWKGQQAVAEAVREGVADIDDISEVDLRGSSQGSAV